MINDYDPLKQQTMTQKLKNQTLYNRQRALIDFCKDTRPYIFILYSPFQQ